MLRFKSRFLNPICILVLLSMLFGCTSPQTSSSVAPGLQSERVNIHLDYPHYASFEEAYEASSLIVHIRILGREDRQIDISMTDKPHVEPYQVYRCELVARYKGEAPGGPDAETLEIKIPGGTVAGVHYVVEGGPTDLSIGSEWLAFLVEYPSTPPSLINLRDGLFAVQGEALVPYDEDTTVSVRFSELKARQAG